MNQLLLLKSSWWFMIQLILLSILSDNLYAQNSFDVRIWLDENDQVKKHINWEVNPDQFLNYESWGSDMKTALDSAIRKVILHKSLDIQDPPELFIKPDVGEVVPTTLYPEDAWRIYLAHIAQSIVTDVYDYVSWKLNEASEEKLIHLFDGSSFYKREVDYYAVQYKHGCATLGDPLFSFNFLKNNNLIGPSEDNTILRILDWGRDNLLHYSKRSGETYEQSYLRCFDGFQGSYPPIKVVIEGVEDGMVDRISHWTKGCHGTTGFLKGICRVLNIEVSDSYTVFPDFGVVHSQPVFPGINVFMCHADDLYSSSAKTSPRLEIDKLLFDLSLYTQLFDPDLEEKNINYKIKYILEYLPYNILHLYCSQNQDINYILDYFGISQYYDDQTELDSVTTRLQQKIDYKLDSLDGCNSSDFWSYYSKYASKPFHNLNEEAEIISLALNMPIYDYTIDENEYRIEVNINKDLIPDTLIFIPVCSDWASIEQANGNNFEIKQPLFFQVTSEDGLTQNNWEISIADPVQIDEYDRINNDFKIIPNPNTGSFMCKFESQTIKEVNLKLINALGQVVEVRRVKLSGNSHEEYFDLSAQVKGIYFIQYTSKEIQLTRKILYSK
ncbi:T9SS type A sorting domain-containing protein [Labilibacter sediminis]|nr:T9SS type A sorting domain-containing protein [Labilibacter sediminis]